MKTFFLVFSYVSDILIILAVLALVVLVVQVFRSVVGFIVVNLKSMFIACFVVYVFLLYSLNCTPQKLTFFYDLITICTKQSNS